MELRVILRGGVSGLLAGLLAFAFAKILVEPIVNRAIDYESGRDRVLAALNKAAGRAVAPDGSDIFSRHTQSTFGILSGLVAFSVGMGLLVAVAYLVLHGRFDMKMRTLALLVTGFGFLGIFLVPFVKYPANPPAIGHSFTIHERSQLYLVMVASSLILLGLAAYLGHRLVPRFGVFNSTVIAGICFIALISVVIGLLPSLGNLSANVAHQHDFGFVRASTETPQPITNLQGQIVYPGFPADDLWKFRLYSVINQLIVWTVIGLCFSTLLQRMARPPKPADTQVPPQVPASV